MIIAIYIVTMAVIVWGLIMLCVQFQDSDNMTMLLFAAFFMVICDIFLTAVGRGFGVDIIQGLLNI